MVVQWLLFTRFGFKSFNGDLRHFPVGSATTGVRGGRKGNLREEAPSPFGPKLESKGGPKKSPKK